MCARSFSLGTSSDFGMERPVSFLNPGSVMKSIMLSQASSIFFVNDLGTKTGVSATRNSIAPGCLLFRSFKNDSYFSLVNDSLNALRKDGIIVGDLFEVTESEGFHAKPLVFISRNPPDSYRGYREQK